MTNAKFLKTAAANMRLGERLILTPEKQLDLIEQILALLEENYVIPEKVPVICDYVRDCIHKDGLNNARSYRDFADTLTAWLQVGSGDKHFRVSPTKNPRGEFSQESFIDHWFQMSDWVRTSDYGFKSVQVLENNVGYINLYAFFSKDVASARADASMKLIENTHAIIIDLRENGGGQPDMVQYLCSYFFNERILLNSLFWLKENATEEFWVLDQVNGKKRPDTALYILTSNKTFSAAEEFAYNMQSRKRATIIGETTGGGGNPGKVFDVSGILDIFISTGRAINPVTQTNWEGIGVKPDIETTSDLALSKALELSLDAAKCTQTQAKMWFASGAGNILARLAEASELLEIGRHQEGKSIVTAAVHQAQLELNFTLRDFKWLSKEYRTRFKSPILAALIMEVVEGEL